MVEEGTDYDVLKSEARFTREKYRNMGFQQGVFASRQEYVQAGFDVGYRAGAVSSFCTSFLFEVSPDTQMLLSHFPKNFAMDNPTEGHLHELDDLHQQINSLITQASSLKALD